MMLDYIFYRAYIAYEKKKQPGLFSATAYCAVICLFLFMPLYGMLDILLKNQESLRKTAIVLYIILIIVSVFFRYFRKNKLRHIIEKYRFSKYNKKIATWLFFLILPLCMILGVWIYALIS
ncbi:hypothetical protein OC25_07945 [Pedobacter kyungheensis]|uniref:Uncharacterized protein n=1 Tax=Pedobacter kyungheensis TaxID=1069985 RepID=A0A0C1G510_9SPHI|nr:hypothetical protein [Pedobacter kyungheensis]KIA95234.1 hypothetical protein OC25_07945 [Pedobacter kyungheensis]